MGDVRLLKKEREENATSGAKTFPVIAVYVVNDYNFRRKGEDY